MAFKELLPGEQQIVLQCMKAIADGHEIGGWEFQTRLGIVRPALKQIISLWPEIDDSSENSDGFLAVNNCLNEVCHGVHWTDTEWRTRFTQPKEEVKKAFQNWLRLRERSPDSIA